MIALAQSGAEEGLWLRAERQSAGRGRMGRDWDSPVGNLYVSHLVRLRTGDPAAPSLAFVAAVAVEATLRQFAPGVEFQIKWPNDVMATTHSSPSPSGEGLGWGVEDELDRRSFPHRTFPTPPPPLKGRGFSFASPTPAKISGLLLERTGDAVVIGMGVNLASHPAGLDRPVTSLAALGVATPPVPTFLEALATYFAQWLDVWRGQGLAPIRDAWLARAHPVGTLLTVSEPDGSSTSGSFDGLDHDCALRLRLADGSVRVIHAGDVFFSEGIE